jgi:hypothetical protein
MNEGFSFLSKTLPRLGKAVELGISSGTFTLPNGFKTKRGEATPIFMGSLFRSIFDKDGTLLNDADPAALKAIRQVCYYTYKCDIPRDPSLDDAVISSFVHTENELHDLVIDDDVLLGVARAVTADLFRGKPNYRPKHGPGKTSNSSLSDKWERRLAPNLDVYDRFGSLFFFNAHDAMDSIHRYPVSTNQDLFRHSVAAEVILVPKDSRGPRLISCEPAEHQFIQQAIMKHMVNRLESSQLTGGQVNFTDQTINQRLAKTASETQYWSTLDLKDASDRNSLQLFHAIFRDSDIYEDVLACRTSHTKLPNGDLVHMAKFAPMGSALCFPVMAYSLFVLMYVALIGKGISPDEAKSMVHVYGDDIVVPTEHAPYLMSVIEKYGFKINRDKSFINSRFAESCGGDYMDGVDVTPNRLRSLFGLFECQESLPYQTLYKLVKHANLGGYSHLSEYWYQFCESFLGFLPYGLATTGFLCRTTSGDRLMTYQSEWMDRVNQGKTRKRVLRVKADPQMGPATGWGHLYRVSAAIGVEDVEFEFGIYDLPRNSRFFWTKETLTDPLVY